MIQNLSTSQTPETLRQRERIVYEMSSLMKDNPEDISLYIEDMILLYTQDQMNEMEDIIVNHYGVEHV
tara:strand:- start:249 stop:452 length:204 start_codon:yes stop_codon:yes gene_type:complete